jgi:hypothetical protein
MTADSPTTSAPMGRTTVARMAAAALAALIAAVVPALVGLVLLGSAALRRPMLGRPARTSAHAASGPAGAEQARRATRLTLAWGTGLLITGLVQGLLALTSGISLANPAGMLTRTLIGIAGVAVLALGTLVWRSRSTQG